MFLGYLGVTIAGPLSLPAASCFRIWNTCCACIFNQQQTHQASRIIQEVNGVRLEPRMVLQKGGRKYRIICNHAGGCIKLYVEYYISLRSVLQPLLLYGATRSYISFQDSIANRTSPMTSSVTIIVFTCVEPLSPCLQQPKAVLLKSATT